MTFHLSWLPGNLAYRLGWTLMHSLWEGAIIAVLSAMLLACLRKQSAATRYSFLLAMLALMVAAFGATFALSPSLKVLSSAQPTAIPTISHNVESAALPRLIGARLPLGLPTAKPPTISQVQRLRIVLSNRMHDVAPILADIWIAGVLLLMVWRAGGLLSAQRLRTIELQNADSQIVGIAQRLAERLNLAATFDVVISRLAPTAMVIGWWRPVILLPASIVCGLAPWQLESILAHELAHICRRDYLVNLVQILAETLLFYHPAIWWISRRIRLEREQACDDMAVSLCGNRTKYAESLAALEELRLNGAVALAASGNDGRQLIARIRRILGVSDVSPRLGRSSAALAVIVLAGVVALLSHQIITHAAGPGSPFVLHNDGPRRSPFTAVQWDGDVPHVQYQFNWYECIAIDDVPASSILDYLKQSKDFAPEKHFAEDLVEVMTQMGHPPGHTVKLNLKSLGTGETLTIPAAEMTEANRRLVLLADARNPSTPATPMTAGNFVNANTANGHATSDFPFVVRFELGESQFLAGDNITIQQIRGTAPSIAPGNRYEITGIYSLASAPRARLSGYVTAIGNSHDKPTPMDPQQTVFVSKGSGAFTVVLPFTTRGYPHLSFYPLEHALGFGDLYFGSGESLKTEDRESAHSAPQPNPTTQATQSTEAELLIRLEQKRVDEWEREYQALRGRNGSSSMASDALKNLRSEYERQLQMIQRLEEAGLLSSPADKELTAAIREKAADAMTKQYSTSTRPEDTENLHTLQEMLSQGTDPLIVKALLDKAAELDKQRAIVAQAQADYQSARATAGDQNPGVLKAAARMQSEVATLKEMQDRLAKETAAMLPQEKKQVAVFFHPQATVMIIVAPNQIYFDGSATSWDALPHLLEKVPNRDKTILAFAMASDQMTLAQHYDALRRLGKLAHDLHFAFAYASDEGIQAPPVIIGPATH